MKTAAKWTKEELREAFGLSLNGTANYRKTKNGFNVSVLSNGKYGYSRVSVSLEKYLSTKAVDPKKYITESEYGK